MINKSATKKWVIPACLVVTVVLLALQWQAVLDIVLLAFGR